ncbi:MAG TPA: hydrogenase maturation protease [Nitrososphaerales archaeon]|nr:hydrogenase maturation protease [Nitrososphaerales archaeon]
MGAPDEHESGGDSLSGIDSAEDSYAGKIVVLGIGNPYMRDDGIGIVVAQELRKRGLGEDIVVYDSQTLEASLIWQFREADALVILDALTSGAPPGTVSRFKISPRGAPIEGIPSLHELRLHDLVDLAGLDLISFPVVIVAVEPKDCSIGEGLTEEMRSALPRVVDEVTRVLTEISATKTRSS